MLNIELLASGATGVQYVWRRMMMMRRRRRRRRSRRKRIRVLIYQALPCTKQGTKCSKHGIPLNTHNSNAGVMPYHGLRCQKPIFLTSPLDALTSPHSSTVHFLLTSDKYSLATGLLSYSPGQKCSLVPVFHMIGPMVAWHSDFCSVSLPHTLALSTNPSLSHHC